VTLINCILKPKCILIHIFEFLLLYENTIWFLLLLLLSRDLAVCMKTKYFFNILTKTRYFNTGFVSLQYKNTNQYWSKCSKIFLENHRFFWNNCFWNFKICFFLTGPNPARLFWARSALPDPVNSGNSGEWINSLSTVHAEQCRTKPKKMKWKGRRKKKEEGRTCGGFWRQCYWCGCGPWC